MMFAAIETVTQAHPLWCAMGCDAHVAAKASTLNRCHIIFPLGALQMKKAAAFPQRLFLATIVDLAVRACLFFGLFHRRAHGLEVGRDVVTAFFQAKGHA